jgi:hypothetical protein
MIFPLSQLQSRRHRSSRGFVTLYAAIVIVMLSSLAFAIGAVGLRQYQIVATGAISQTAQYFAESGMECALYARLNAFFDPAAPNITCVGTTISVTSTAPQYLYFPGGGCARIQFTATEITSRGYDRGTSATGCPGSGARVERGYIERQLQGALQAMNP